MRVLTGGILGVVMVVVACGSDTTIFGGTGGAASSTSQGSGGDSTSTTASGGTAGAGGAAGGGGAGMCDPGTSEPCYSGPGGTEGIGICQAGSRTCQPDGTFGACEGEVVPGLDDCTTSEDEDCNGSNAVCTSGDHVWSKAFGGADVQEGMAVAVDASGNVFAAGNFAGQIDILGTQHVAGTIGYHPYLAKLDAAGSPLWSKVFISTQSARAEDVAATVGGGVVLVGHFSGDVSFGGATLEYAGNLDLYIAAFDAQGNHAWSKRYGDANFQHALQVATDPSGNVIVTGVFAGSLGFEGLPLLNAQSGAQNIFVLKMSATGTPLWVEHIIGSSETYVRDLAVDGQGNVLIVGYFNNAFDAGAGTMVSAGAYDAFLLKLSPAGSLLWSTRYGDGGQQMGTGVAAGANGTIALTGRMNGTVDFGGGALNGGSGSVFVAQLSSSGAHLASDVFGTGINMAGHSRIGIDPFGHLVVFGSHHGGTMDLGGGALPKPGDYDVYVGKLTSNHAHAWSEGFGSSSSDDAQRMVIDPQGNTLITGSFQGPVDFGGGLLTPNDRDAFLVKLAP